MRLHWYAGWLVHNTDVIVQVEHGRWPISCAGGWVPLRPGVHSDPLPLHSCCVLQCMLGVIETVAVRRFRQRSNAVARYAAFVDELCMRPVVGSRSKAAQMEVGTSEIC